MAGDFSSLPAKRKKCRLLAGSRRVWKALVIAHDLLVKFV